MKLALFADIHSNLEALQACLVHARTQGAERFAFLGDLVGYGPDPVAVLELIQSYAAEGAVVVLGNHDAAALGNSTETINHHARAAIEWTRAQLSDRHVAFLSGLPLIVHEENMTFVHASAAAPDKWIYVSDPLRAAYSLEATPASYLLSGHVHEQMLYYTGAGGRPMSFVPTPGVAIPVARHRRWLVIAGSAGQPRDGNPAACYAMLDNAHATLTYHRVPYPHVVTADKIRAAGLPERLALRLEHGD